MSIYLNPINYNFLNDLDLTDIKGFIESIIPLPEGNMLVNPSCKIYGFIPEESSITYNYFKEILLEKNITIDYEYYDNSDNYGYFSYNKDGLIVNTSLWTVCDNLTDIEITIFNQPN